MKKLDKTNTEPVKVLGVPLRAEPELVGPYNEALRDLHIALDRLWIAILTACRIIR